MAKVQSVTREEMLSALAGSKSKRTRPRLSRAGGGARPCPYRCVDCDEHFGNYTSFERHADSQGHHRGQILL